MNFKIRTAATLLFAFGLLSTAAIAEDAVRPPYVNLKYPTPTEDLINPSETLVRHGMTYLGVRYRFGGTSRETGLDCSGLILNVFQHAGVDLPRRAADMARLGVKVDKKDLQPGDLVFFNTRKQAYSHVGLYLGDGQFLHAPSSGGKVRVDSMNGRYWVARYNGARRLIDEESNS
jgi:cell wall-associated NlpC family hydrolase